MLPDVVCDFSQVQISQIGENRVQVSNTKGHAPPDTYKVSATYFDGFRVGTMMSFVGLQAAQKARVFADAAFARTSQFLRQHNLAEFEETSVEVIGDDSQYGAAAAASQSREVVLKIAAKHEEMSGAGALLKEISGLGLATPAGLSIFAGSRAKPSPLVRLFSFLIAKTDIQIKLDVDGVVSDFSVVAGQAFDVDALVRPDAPIPIEQEGLVDVPLVKLAWGRSGDKGNKSNIGIIARQPEYLPYIWAALDEATIAQRFGHFMAPGSLCTRYYLPGSHSINFLLDEALGGGGVASLRNDPQGKAYAQILLDHPIAVPTHIAEAV